ncbi:efflux RND transporter permease subunit [Desulfoluna spongiiphila]|uniref:efflux RND transporter permease subunit n=1 Tax=Desulfoluna spongiiphila TaxID=419481 RepID=UPI00125FE700|nr:efflux RND transporter permease subunit [Desulfoluna spongiiphila]
MSDRNTMDTGVVMGMVKRFLTSKLSVIMVMAALLLGMAAILITPREEEPQIVVPMADIYVQAPGATAEEVEHLVATPLEQLLWQIDGVEYVYSMARRDMAVVTVRFFVGESREHSLVKLYNKINMNIDKVAPLIRGWVVKPVEIDDVPIVAVTLYSEAHDDHQLRRVGEELLARLAEVKNVSGTQIVGGRKREVRVALQPERMKGLGVSLLEVNRALSGSDAAITAGHFSRVNTEYTVTSSSFLKTTGEVKRLVVGVASDRPVYLRDVAEVMDGPEEPRSYSRLGFSHQAVKTRGLEGKETSMPAVTLAIAKKKGTNAVTVSRDVLEKLQELKATMVPAGMETEVIRNNGQTAQDKVNGLLGSLAFAVLSVVVLLMIALGWREALVVAVAVPISFSLALFVNHLFGYTINRVTLFALILSLGLVVDDPITNVENIQRHMAEGTKNAMDATLYAIGEVLSPVIMSTISIIVCFTPLFFITGMMGPYMAPMAINVPLTVTFSTLCALTIVPWMTYLLLKGSGTALKKEAHAPGTAQASRVVRLYRRAVGFFLVSQKRRKVLAAAVGLLFIASALLAAVGLVPLKLLPFDNKNEFQIVLDMPEGTTLESTDAVVRRFEAYLEKVPEVTSIATYTGTSSPMDFNGMVRHYYLRQGSHLADLRVNLTDKSRRSMQSHAIVLRLRADLEALARETGATLNIVEVPPGPPVLATLVAELYGSPETPYSALIDAADEVAGTMGEEAFVTDVDTTAVAPHTRVEVTVDREKAALHGVDTRAIIRTLAAASGGAVPAQVHAPRERTPLNIRVTLPLASRSGMAAIGNIPVKTSDGSMVPLAEITTIHTVLEEQPILHKNLERVVFVTAEMAGRAPAEAVLSLKKKVKHAFTGTGIRINWSGEGEWKITLRVFRDMGIAFAAALLGIYILLVIQSGSFSMPVLIMMAIPLTILGIMPGFFLLNLVTAEQVGGYHNPVFFTATSMIGMIALGGIVIRNALVLIEFIQDATKAGMPLAEAVLQSGSKRLRPIVLTALTTAIGAVPITFDPVFSGLAWALIFGLLASTLFTLVIIPVTYYALHE